MIGRKKEVKELNDLYDSNRAELVAVYGRRRIGKTYLINETFDGRLTFSHSGLSPVDSGKRVTLDDQLSHFYHSLLFRGMKKTHVPANWLEAFFMLEKYLTDIDDGSRQVVFFDELPWLDTPKSGFLTAFEAFWNTWACSRHNIMVIVCGSASSWVLDKLINNHGGLYGRVTYEIKLSPFTLAECEEFLLSRNVIFSRYDITQTMMMLGGVPYYLGYLKGNLSLEQNIDALFFEEGAKLAYEYDRLFASVFSNPGQMKMIVEFLAGCNSGYTRNEIAEGLSKSGGGAITNNLTALIVSGFIEKYVPFCDGRRKAKYKLSDPFCIFYLHFVKSNNRISPDFWRTGSRAQSIISWRGFAFENICFRHMACIKEALGIKAVFTTASVWDRKGTDGNKGIQIDMILDRDDNIVNLCEIKFYSESFTVDKDYYLKMLERRSELEKVIPKKKVVRNVLIATMGLKQNSYSNVFTNVITLDDLFKE